MQLDEEMVRGNPSTQLPPEPLMVILSPPPPFLPVPGEPVIPWDSWRKSFEQYLEALSETSLSDSSKCALLQNCLGHEGHRVYETLVQSETTYTAAVFTLTVHFSSCHNPQMCRFKFRRRAQRPGESVEQFVSALEELVKPCNFGDLEDELILDQLIEKTNCKQLRERLLLEPNTLTLANALIIGKQVEYALGKSASSIQNGTLELEEATYMDNEDRPVQRVLRGGRTRRSERLKELKPQETKTPSNMCGHNKDDDHCDNDEQYHGEDGSQTDDSSDDDDDDDDDGVDDTEDEDFDYDDAKDKDYEVGDEEVTGSNIPKKQHSCPICVDRSFKHASLLARHMSAHTKDKPFRCPVCSMTFSQSYHMNRHLRICHDDYNGTNDKDYEVGDDETDDSDDGKNEIAGGKRNDDDKDNANDGAGGAKDITGSKTKKRGHFCPICINRSFRGPNKLARHMRTHTKEKPFSCPVCAKTFSQSYHKNRHLKIQHGLSRQYICSKCGQSLGSWGELKTHKRTHAKEEFSCPHCDEKFPGKIELLHHIKTQRADQSDKPNSHLLVCADCGKTFDKMFSFKRHMVTHDKSLARKRHQCPDCEKSYVFLKELNKHLESHQKEKSGTCLKCDQTFSCPEELEKHMKVHETSYLCTICGKKFKVEYALKKHELLHRERRFYCSLCDKQFPKLSHFTRHQKVHTRQETKCPHCERIFLKLRPFKHHLRAHVKERPYQCSYCVESFTQKEDLELHCVKHREFKKENPYSCTRCDHAFSSLEELTAHMTAHQGEQAMSCPDCGMTFLNKSKLEKHLTIHTGERAHLCTICGHGFPSMASLKMHMWSHTGEKPFKCSHCNKSYTSSSGLRLHSRHHMAVRPSFSCPDCGRTYGRLTELRMHQRYHTGDKPYACSVCSKRFVKKDKLSVHMRIHTGERPYSCSQCGQTFTQAGDRNRHMSKYHQ